MEKINVLTIASDTSGVSKFRTVDPHVKLQNMYPDEFHVDIEYSVDTTNISFWKKYQIVHFHRNIGNDYDYCPQFIKYLQSIGIVVIMDIDDYWLPTKEHPIQQIILQNKIHEKIIANIKVSDYITTTTDIFANEIRRLNKEESFIFRMRTCNENVLFIWENTKIGRATHLFLCSFAEHKKTLNLKT